MKSTSFPTKRIAIWVLCYLLVALVLFFGARGISSLVQVSVNQSESLPQRAFLFVPVDKIARENYVSFDNAWSHKNLIKQVAGIAGDKVEIIDGEVWVKRYIGPLQPTTREGKPLTRIAPGKIPEGYVFVASPHERSFDSRYAEVGLVPIAMMKRAIPFF